MESSLPATLRIPGTQIGGFQGPRNIQSMDFGTLNPTIWVLGLPFFSGFRSLGFRGFWS